MQNTKVMTEEMRNEGAGDQKLGMDRTSVIRPDIKISAWPGRPFLWLDIRHLWTLDISSQMKRNYD